MLDPFCGTGTTGAVAKHLGRRFIGIERDAGYAKAAEKRIARVKPLEAPTLAPFMTARDAPRVPFAALIERGLIKPGARLVDEKSAIARWYAQMAQLRSGPMSGRFTALERWRWEPMPATAGLSGTSRRRRASP